MKGVELPINTMVIVVLAVIILLALVAMYFSGFGPFSTAVGLEGVRGDACRRLVQENGCRVSTSTIGISDYDANKNNKMGTTEINTGWTWGTGGSVCGQFAAGDGDNLASLCNCTYGLTTETACRGLCGCS
jgi:hypothetical protein